MTEHKPGSPVEPEPSSRPQGSSRPAGIGDQLRENRSRIIRKKEQVYDRAIDKLHLTTRAIDIFIIVMIVAAVLIVLLTRK